MSKVRYTGPLQRQKRTAARRAREKYGAVLPSNVDRDLAKCRREFPELTADIENQFRAILRAANLGRK